MIMQFFYFFWRIGVALCCLFLFSPQERKRNGDWFIVGCVVVVRIQCCVVLLFVQSIPKGLGNRAFTALA